MEENKIFTILNYLRASYQLGLILGEFEVYDDNTFNLLLKKSNYELDDKLLKQVKRILDSEFQIYQPDGTALLDDYEHIQDWYSRNKSNFNHHYWERYKNYLAKNGWNTNILEKLENNTLEHLMNYLGDPNSSEYFSRKGLVMGDVQSGKTSNYIGLICKAVDAGYKVIILLSGTIEPLRRQTQIRVEEGFIGFDVENKKWVGVGESQIEDYIPMSGTSRAHDFIGNSGENTFLHIKKEDKPIIFVTKKHYSVLTKIRETLERINIKPPHTSIDNSLLIIDDEADNASINTNTDEYDPTRINTEIRKLLSIFTKSNYVGFTATPFANIFIDPNSETEMLNEDLFPKDFIFSLNSPSNYLGPEQIFVQNKYNIVKIIDDFDNTFPLIHKKEWRGQNIYDSLKNAISAFLLINSIRDLSEGEMNNSHRSMMINLSRFIKVQEHFEKLVKNYYDNVLRSVKYAYSLPKNEYLKNEYIKRIFDVYQKEYIEEYSWDEVFSKLYESIKNIEIYKIPFTDKRRKLDYEKFKDKGLRVIVIGGLSLSRGLTLEGLTISYLYRNTATFDVLMQMGRWFGYRNKPMEYGHLCRVWMLERTNKYFKEITESILQLKKDFQRLIDSNKTPKDFGIRVRNESEELGITSRNKMRKIKKHVYWYDIYGQVMETPFISKNAINLKDNYNTVLSLLNSLKFIEKEKPYVATNISKELILQFLHDFNVHEANSINYFEKNRLIDFITESNLLYFDVALIEGKGRLLNIDKLSVNSVERSFDILNSDTLRIGGTHYRLGGTSDTKYGLTNEQLDKLSIEEKKKQSGYLIEDRNPILMIYPLSLKKISDDEKAVYSLEEIEEIESTVNNMELNKVIPFGIGIGFPRKSNFAEKQRSIYYINTATKWLELMNAKDGQNDE